MSRIIHPFARAQVDDGDRASLLRCMRMLEKEGVEGVQVDPNEYPYCLEVDQVAGMCYLQNGYFTERTGLPPDFWFIDTMWEKMK